jgi:hypothetical protein
MLRTEAEAKDMDCCVTTCGRTRIDNPHTLNAITRRVCIGSKCMGWRFVEALFDGPDSYQADPPPKGYCGRAGQPVMR